MKKLIATILIAAMLVMCCSCGLARDIAQLARERLQEAGTDGRLPQHGSLPALPSQPEPQIEAEDETSPLEEEFAQLADPEGLLAGNNVPTLADLEQNGLYTYREDTGRYVKSTPFMGKDSNVELGFNLNGKNNYIDYWYTGSRKTVNAQQIVKEYDYLYTLARERYGKVTIHSWLINPLGVGDNFVVMGEFDEEEITDAVNENEVAEFYYAWSRPGNSAVYVYLHLLGDDTYEIGLSYDSSTQFTPSPDAFVSVHSGL